jgi:hypothetical protein
VAAVLSPAQARRLCTVRWLIYRENLWLGLAGTGERPAAGLCPRPAREKGFPSNLLLIFN